jgi:type I restriction enzyme S subunit
VVTGKPYKSSGGKMVWNEELGKDVPEGWEVGILEDFILIKNGKTKPDNIGNIPVYGGNGIIEYVSHSNYEGLNIIGRVGAYCGSVYYNDSKVWISDNALAGISKNDTIYFDYLLLKSLNLNSKSEGSSHPLLTQGILNNITVLKANNNIIYTDFEDIIKNLFEQINNIANQNQKLTQLQSLLLSRLAVGEEEKRKIMV